MALSSPRCGGVSRIRLPAGALRCRFSLLARWSTPAHGSNLRSDLTLEILALRQQLAVLSGSSRRRWLQPADRLFWSWLAGDWSPWRSVLMLVQPDTIVRWHRTACFAGVSHNERYPFRVRIGYHLGDSASVSDRSGPGN